MKSKMLFVLLLLVNVLYANYYTSSNLKTDGNKKFVFEDNLIIDIKNDGVNISKFSDVFRDNKPMKYKDTLYKKTKEVKENNVSRVIEITKKFNTYNLLYLILNNVDDETFVLKLKDKYYFVKRDEKSIEFDTLFGNKDAYEITYTIIGLLHNNKMVNTSKKKILKKIVSIDGELLGIDILNNGLKKVVKVEDKYLKKFLHEKATRELKVKKFDFSNQKIYTTYVSSSSDSQKRLKVTYQMSKKNIKIVTESPISLLDPENKSDNIVQNVGFLREFKNDLYELKKLQLVNGKIEVDWLNIPKKNFVLLKFNNEGNEDKKFLSKSKGQQFYSIEGVIYLVSWMEKNGINQKIFTFINGSLPFDITMKKTSSKTYSMQKSGNTIYKFVLDNRNIVKTILYPSYNLKITLESVESDTTIRNREYLKNFINIHNITLIKE